MELLAIIPQQPLDQLPVKGYWLYEQFLMIIRKLSPKRTVKPLHMSVHFWGVGRRFESGEWLQCFQVPSISF